MRSLVGRGSEVKGVEVMGKNCCFASAFALATDVVALLLLLLIRVLLPCVCV